MTIPALINRPCVVVHRSPGEEEDEYGNKIPVEVSTETVCELQQVSQSESEDQVSDATCVAFFLPGTEIDAADTVTVDGRDYEVIGEPNPRRNPRTQLVSHIEAGLRRTAGGEGS